MLRPEIVLRQGLSPTGLLVLALLACGPTGSGGVIAEARRAAPFPLLVPKCLPAAAQTTPLVQMETYRAGVEDFSVAMTYRFKRAPASGQVDRAVGIIHHRSFSPRVTVGLNSGGRELVLDGRRAARFDSGAGIEWMEDGTRIVVVVNTGDPDDTLRVFHSMVTDESDCSLPIVG
jgi:hypothetical protein